MAITRLDKNNNPRTVGWWVRVRRNNKMYSKLFSDSVCGGNRKALKMAKIYEQELLNTLPQPVLRKEYPNTNNTYGVSKIYLTGGSMCTYWYNDDGSQGKATFSVNFYGSIALTLAVMSYMARKRVTMCNATQHKNIQKEYAGNFPNLEEIRSKFVKEN